MSLHVPAGACIPVASVSPIHVPPVQCVLKIKSIVMWCTQKYIYSGLSLRGYKWSQEWQQINQQRIKLNQLYIKHVIQNNLGHPSSSIPAVIFTHYSSSLYKCQLYS